MDKEKRSMTRRNALKLAATSAALPLASGQSMGAERRARYNQSGETRYASYSGNCSSQRDRDYFELTNTTLYYRGSAYFETPDEYAHSFMGASHGATRLFDRYDRYDGSVKPAYDLRRLVMDVIGRGSTKRVVAPQNTSKRGQNLSTDPEYDGGNSYDVHDALEDVTKHAIGSAYPTIGTVITAAEIINSLYSGNDNDSGTNLRYDFQFGDRYGGQKKDAHLNTFFTVYTSTREFDVQLSTGMESHPEPQCPVDEDSRHEKPGSGIRLIHEPNNVSTTQSGTRVQYEDITDPVFKHEATPGEDIVKYYFPTERVPPIPMPVGNLDQDRLGGPDDRYDSTDIYTNYVYVDLENETIAVADPQGNLIGDIRFDVGQDIRVIVPFDSNGSGEPDAFAILLLDPNAAAVGLFTNADDGEQDALAYTDYDEKAYIVADLQASPESFDSLDSESSVGYYLTEDELAGRFLIEFDQGPLGNSTTLLEYDESYDINQMSGGLVSYAEYLAAYPGNQVDYGYTQYLIEYTKDAVY